MSYIGVIFTETPVYTSQSEGVIGNLIKVYIDRLIYNECS